MNADAAPGTAHFVEKWFRREPEMRFAATFCARADESPATAGDVARASARFHAWGALLHELREALFELTDAGVAAAKRGWWAEELQAIAQGRARHPLGEAIVALPQSSSAPWTGLALALVGGGGEPRAADTVEAIGALRPLARATLAVEDALFDSESNASTADALAVHWLLHRMPRGLGEEDAARVPMHLLARHGLRTVALAGAPDALLRDWAAELLDALPPRAQGAFLRRARLRFDRARLRRLRDQGGKGGFDDPGLLPTLVRGWQAARDR